MDHLSTCSDQTFFSIEGCIALYVQTCAALQAFPVKGSLHFHHNLVFSTGGAIISSPSCIKLQMETWLDAACCSTPTHYQFQITL